MTRRTSLLLILILFMALGALAQYGGHRGGSGASHGSGTTGQPAEDPDLAGFKHDVAVQATENQRAQFQSLAQRSEAARRKAHDLQQAGSASNPSTLGESATALRDAVDDAQRANRDFVNTFSDSQDAGLKKLTKRLSKSNTAVTKDASRLDAQLDKVPLDAHGLTSVADSLEKALTSLQTEQFALAKEMGIQSH